MWQHKQQERELKRVETDIVRQRKQLERSAQQYEESMSNVYSVEPKKKVLAFFFSLQ